MREPFIPIQRRSGETEVEELRALCHDLRQYISACLLLATPPDQPSRVGSPTYRLQLIRGALGQAASLLDTANQGTPAPHQTLDLVELVHDCVTMVEVTGRVHFVSEARELTLVHGDAGLLRRAVNNLVDNAARAAGDTGEVVVRVGTESDDAWVEVSDDGPGFGKVSAGTGRGLAVVSQAARGHGGHVEILGGSEPGTRVRLALPREKAPARPRSRSER
jgi:signal transduction histidine kinase